MQVCVFCLASQCPQSHQVDKRILNTIDDQPRSASNQSPQPLQGNFAYGDNSEKIFSIYSKAVKEEDDKMVERWQKDAEGILIFVSPDPWLRTALLLV